MLLFCFVPKLFSTMNSNENRMYHYISAQRVPQVGRYWKIRLRQYHSRNESHLSLTSEVGQVYSFSNSSTKGTRHVFGSSECELE